MNCIVAIFNSPCHLGSHILSLRVGLVCAVCLHVETIAWLPMLGIFLHAHNTNFNACNCKRRLCKHHKRVKTETDRLRGVGWHGWWGGVGSGGWIPSATGSQTCMSSPADLTINHQATALPKCCSNFMGQQSVLYHCTSELHCIQWPWPTLWHPGCPGQWRFCLPSSDWWGCLGSGSDKNRTVFHENQPRPPKNLKKFWASNYDLSCYANKIHSQSTCLTFSSHIWHCIS